MQLKYIFQINATLMLLRKLCKMMLGKHWVMLKASTDWCCVLALVDVVELSLVEVELVPSDVELALVDVVEPALVDAELYWVLLS